MKKQSPEGGSDQGLFTTAGGVDKTTLPWDKQLALLMECDIV